MEQDQIVRKALDPEAAAKIDEFLAKVKSLMEMKEPFHLVSRLE